MYREVGWRETPSNVSRETPSYPNPTDFAIMRTLKRGDIKVQPIDLYDIIGHKVKTISSNSFEEKNKYSHSVNLEELSTGVYFVKVKVNNSETTIKLIVAN